MKRGILLILIISLLLIKSVSATDYYVRPIVTDGDCTYDSCDGSDYDNAWEGFSGGDGTAVDWDTVDTGDGKIFVCGAHRRRLSINVAGEDGTPIKVVSCEISRGASVDDPGSVYASDNITGGDNYFWNESGTSNRWFLVNQTFGNPGLSSPNTYVWVDITPYDEGAFENLTDNEWAYGDNDSLGFNTTYIYSTTDPDLLGVEINAVHDTYSSVLWQDFISIEGISFYYGATAVLHFAGSHQTLDGVSIKYGSRGVTGPHTAGNISILNSEFSYNAANQLIYLYNGGGTNAVIKNNNIHHGSATGISFWASNVGTPNNNITIQNNSFHNIGGSGLQVGFCNNVSVLDNFMYNNIANGIVVEGGTPNYNTTDLLIEGNSVWNNSGVGEHPNCAAIWLSDVIGAVVRKNNLTSTTYGIIIDTSYNSSIYQNLIYNNSRNTASLGVYFIQGSGNSFYNNIIYSNGPTSGGTHGGVYTINTHGNVLKNNIVSENKNSPLRIRNGTTTLDYNLYYNPGGFTYKWIGINYATLALFKTASNQETNGNELRPLMINPNKTDFQLQWNSPAIDAGTDVNLSTDYARNPIYGTPDIGAYEYQPPYNISINSINLSISDKIRVYGNGKYRHINSTTSSTKANLKLVATPSFNPSNYSQWMDINITSWTSTLMNWSESSEILGNTTNTTHTICGLTPEDQYDVYYTKSAVRTLIARYTVDSSGCIGFNYIYGYSTVIFDMQKYTTPEEDVEEELSSGGGFPHYHPTKADLQKGYLKLMAKDWKIKFKMHNENHELKVNEVKHDSVTITISSEQFTFNLFVNETKKININKDDYYDLSVLLKGIKKSRADLFIKSINESIFKEDKSVQQEDDLIKKKIKNYQFIYMIIGIILFFGLTIFFYFQFFKSSL